MSSKKRKLPLISDTSPVSKIKNAPNVFENIEVKSNLSVGKKSSLVGPLTNDGASKFIGNMDIVGTLTINGTNIDTNGSSSTIGGREIIESDLNTVIDTNNISFETPFLITPSVVTNLEIDPTDIDVIQKNYLTSVSTTGFTLTIPRNAKITNTSCSSDTAAGLSSAIIDGYPAVAYYDTVGNGLKYVRATDLSGTAWSSAITVDTNIYTSSITATSNISLTTVAGNPAIAYRDLSGGKLKYVRATDASGSTWGSPVTIATSGTDGFTPSLVITSGGNPGMVFTNTGPSRALLFLLANDSTGSSWTFGNAVTVENSVSPESPVGIIVNSNPAVLYTVTGSPCRLKYVRATAADGSTWGSILTIFSRSTSISMGSIAIVAGNPAIAYTTGDTTGASSLIYTLGDDANGTAFSTSVTISVGTDTPSSARLNVINGSPSIVYFSSSTVKYINALDGTGSTWDVPKTILISSSRNILLPINTAPGIAYINSLTNIPALAVVGNFTYVINWMALTLSSSG
jgi:hypothetical protein